MTYKELYEKAIWLLEHNEINGKEYDKMIEPLNAEVGNAEPVRHGKWVGAESQCAIGCPFCGTPVDDFCVSIDYIELLYEPNYCPNCGAKMERKEE